MSPRKRRVANREFDNATLLELCDRFLRGDSADDIALWLRALRPGLDVARTRVYPLLQEARLRGLFRLEAPSVRAQERALAAVSGRQPAHVVVVDARGDLAAEHVARRGAEVALDLIMELWAGRTRDGGPAADALLRVGLGGGRTMRHLGNELARRLRARPDRPPLGVHALSTGFDPLAPQTAPITFLGAFGDIARELVGLFTSGMLEPDELEALRARPGVAKSFALAREIALPITSLASADDETGALRSFLAHGDDPRLRQSHEELVRRKWIGDLLYEPYDAQGPIEHPLPVRAVSVLSLAELAAFRRDPERRVLLVVAPSPGGRSKAKALLPLLRQPRLDVWTHLVVDTGTAEEVLRSEELRPHLRPALSMGRPPPRPAIP